MAGEAAEENTSRAAERETAPAGQASLQDDPVLRQGQTRLLEMIATGAPLSDTLDELTRLIEAQEEGLRCGIASIAPSGEYLCCSNGPSLSAAYHGILLNTPVTPPYSGPCAQAADLGETVSVSDIASDTRWTVRWRKLALSCNLAACCSTPVRDSQGRVLASFALYYDRPCDPQPARPDIIAIATHLAGIALERERTETALANHRQYLARELAATQQLQTISTVLIQEDDIDGLYRHALDAAINLMEADAASLQMLDPEADVFRLLTWKGFYSASAAHWERAGADADSARGQALRAGKRVVVADFEASAIAGSKEINAYRWTGLRAAQSTPLVSRSGRILGLLSTYWRHPYQPPKQKLKLLDVLTRQAADLMDRMQAEESLQQEIRAARAAEAHNKLLLGELSHRVKNTLATVQSLAAQTLRNAPGLEAFQSVFMARLMALSHTHDLLQDSNWRGVSLRDLVLTELMPYADPHIQSRWSLGSEAVVISPSQALALHMAVHELAANAGKFGALSTSAGHVDVNWTVEETGERCMLSLLWAEQGGPAVGTPQRQGFGLRLIQDGLAYELDADVQLDFTSDGIRCTIDFPLESTGKIKPLREMS